MAEKNDDSTGMFVVVAFLATGAMVLAMMAFALLSFFAFVLTILAFWAWNKPRQVGKIIIEPDEARSFVHRGLAGAVLVPMFIALASSMFEVVINWDYVNYFIVGGYVAGSLGLEMLFAQEQAQAQAQTIVPEQKPSLERLPAPPRTFLPPQDQEPFRFASWDDEEPRG